MTHYDTLGVPVGAAPEVVRDAYKALARRYHPDAAAQLGPSEREAAEARMREVNAAWAVLGEPASRAAYDRDLGIGGATGEGRAFVRRFEPVVFVPVEDDDEDWEESAIDGRYVPDEGDPRSAPGRPLLAVPMVFGFVALLALGMWLLLEAEAFLAAAVVLGACTAASLFILPVVVMARAARLEDEARLRRGRTDGP